MPEKASPRVLISYSHDSPEHRDQVRLLADQLREWGIDAWLDQYAASPPKGWARWMDREFKKADFILLVCTETYRRRFDDEEEDGKGLGVTWEALKVIRELYLAKGENRRFIPILLAEEDVRHIPEPFADHDRYLMPDDWESLYRRLTDQPSVEPPPLGPLRDIPPVSAGIKTGEMRERYLRHVARRCGHLSMASIDPKARQPSGYVQLDQIFTRLDTRKSSALDFESARGARGRKPSLDPAEMEKQSREPVLAAGGNGAMGNDNRILPRGRQTPARSAAQLR